MDRQKEYEETIALLNAKEATPVKPRENYNWDDIKDDIDYSDEHWLCPLCNRFLDESENYCPECGGKLDWGQSDDK